MTQKEIYRRKKLQQMKRRRKIATLVLVALGVFLIITLITSFTKPNSAAEVTDTYIEYTVSKGDTLWDIARFYSDDNVDVRIVIREIEEKNNLEGALIYCGDKLLVPTKYSGD